MNLKIASSILVESGDATFFLLFSHDISFCIKLMDGLRLFWMV